jgi:hypothetical protein
VLFCVPEAAVVPNRGVVTLVLHYRVWRELQHTPDRVAALGQSLARGMIVKGERAEQAERERERRILLAIVITY